jgi:branched-chain amino acid transport system permease protein
VTMQRYIVDYEQDRNLLRTSASRIGMACLLAALCMAPFVIPAYFAGEMAFIFIMGIASMGLMILTGFTGQVSLGHSAFIAIGAYVHTILLMHGWPWPVSLLAGAFVSAVMGLVIGLPAIRVSGLHLTMVTLAFAIVVEHTLGQWTSVTGGNGGLAVPEASLFGLNIAGTKAFYFVCLAVLILVLLGIANLMRSPLGRAWIGVRDSSAAAQGLGIHLATYKVSAFVMSASVCGLAGGLLAHQVQFVTPDAFGLPLSLQLMMMVFIGGMGSLRGALLGAVLIGILPTAVSVAKGWMPPVFQARIGLELVIYGAILTLFVLAEPHGLNGRLTAIGEYLTRFPLVQRGGGRRSKTYMRSERLR